MGLISVFVVGGLVAACSSSKSGAPAASTASTPGVLAIPAELPETYDDLVPYYNYATDRPFALTTSATQNMDGGVTVQTISFVGAAGDRVDAYLVLPVGDGPFPGLLFEHRGDFTRDQFLPEAVSLAQSRHFASLLMTRLLGGASEELSPIESVIQVREIRRDLDFLQSQPQVDRTRLGYVGHSLGAMLGIIATAVDTRLKAAVYMAPMPTVDLITFAGHSAAGSSLLQFGSKDMYYTEVDANQFAALLPGDKKVSWYDAPHELNDQAKADRDAWLADKLAAK